MKKKNILFCMALIMTAFSACSTDKQSRALFNGNDVEQWNAQGDVKTENQTLSLGNGASLVLKKGDYTNFEFTLTARTVDNGKGFVAFHTDKDGNEGYQVALNNDLAHPQWWTKTGSLLAVRNITKSLAKSNDWFDMVIRVEGKAITVNINGSPVVEYIEPASPYRSAEHTGQLLSHGKFAVKTTEGVIEIKSISLKPINSAIDVAQQQAGAIDETTDDIIRLHQENFPVLDYHVHLKGGMTGEDAAAQARKYGINYAIAPNCGIGFPITDDAGVIHYLDSMKGQPFILAMQGEGREWPVTFSKEVRDKFDYVFTDAMTFIDGKGRRTRLWMPDEVWIENEQQYMDLIVQKTVDVMQEPMDVYVNPTFLPDAMNGRYDEFWTNERMDKVIAALVESGKAVEINHRFQIPHKPFIEKAKAAGLKFTFGTNNVDADFGKLEYCIQLKNECGLTADDMYKPKEKN